MSQQLLVLPLNFTAQSYLFISSDEHETAIIEKLNYFFFQNFVLRNDNTNKSFSISTKSN